MDIITRRPEGMDYSEYKATMRAQKKVLKRRLKGRMVWLSKLHNSPQVIKMLVEDNLLNTIGRLLHKGETFVGSTKDLK